MTNWRYSALRDMNNLCSLLVNGDVTKIISIQFDMVLFPISHRGFLDFIICAVLSFLRPPSVRLYIILGAEKYGDRPSPSSIIPLGNIVLSPVAIIVYWYCLVSLFMKYPCSGLALNWGLSSPRSCLKIVCTITMLFTNHTKSPELKLISKFGQCFYVGKRDKFQHDLFKLVLNRTTWDQSQCWDRSGGPCNLCSNVMTWW